MTSPYEPAGRSVPDLDPEDGWRRYSAGTPGYGFAVAAAIIGTLGLLAGVNMVTVQFLFFGWFDLLAPALLGATALMLAAAAPPRPGRRARIVGFVTGGIALAIGLAFFLSL